MDSLLPGLGGRATNLRAEWTTVQGCGTVSLGGPRTDSGRTTDVRRNWNTIVKVCSVVADSQIFVATSCINHFVKGFLTKTIVLYDMAS